MTYFADVYRGRRVLVTGHTGFKGSWLALWLRQLGAEVAGYSLAPPTAPSNFELLGLAGRLRHTVADVRDRGELARVLDDFRPDMVFHLAAQALVQASYADPVTTFETNTMGVVNLLDYVRTRPSIQVAVVVTSDKAYRNDEWEWGYRETDRLAGKDPYSGSKSCADIAAQAYYHSFIRHTPTRMGIARAGNVIGGGDWAADRIVPDTVRAWTRGEAVGVRSPQATRPWQHVLEPLSGYLWLGAKLWEESDGVNGEAFNFGPDAHVNETVAELLDEMMARWPGMQWRPEGSSSAGHEAKLLKLSCDKARFHMGWRAVLDFPETVALTVDWYRAWHEKRTPLFEYSVGQIDQYCSLATDRGAAWARG